MSNTFLAVLSGDYCVVSFGSMLWRLVHLGGCAVAGAADNEIQANGNFFIVPPSKEPIIGPPSGIIPDLWYLTSFFIFSLIDRAKEIQWIRYSEGEFTFLDGKEDEQVMAHFAYVNCRSWLPISF